MYTLFNNDSNDKRTHLLIPKYNNVKKIINTDIQNVMDHFRGVTMVFPHNHVLIRILSILNVSFNRTVEDYIATAAERTTFIARALKLIHPVNSKVTTHNGTFYNESITEYIIASDDSFDLQYVNKHWGYVSAVKIHTHPLTDVSYGYASGRYVSTSETGVAVISINIPMLAFQWRCFNTLFNSNDSFYQKVATFLNKFVMLNTLRRHTEHTVLNRFMHYYLQKPVANFIKQHNVYVNDNTVKVDECVIEMVKTIKSKKLEAKEIFTMFPTLRYHSWSNIIRLPDLATTQYTKWVYLVTYLPYIEFYLTLATNKDTRLDRDMLFDIRRQMRYLDNTRGLIIPLDRTSAMRLMYIKSMLANLTA